MISVDYVEYYFRRYRQQHDIAGDDQTDRKIVQKFFATVKNPSYADLDLFIREYYCV
jgi:hypothetical protein